MRNNRKFSLESVENKTSPKRKTGILRMTISITAVAVGFSLFSLFVVYIYISSLIDELPEFERLEKYEPNLITKTYSADGVLIKEFFSENRSPVDLDSIPSHIIQALISTEDRDFLKHWGFNSRRTAIAAMMAIPRKLTGKNVHGASTITQQLARNLYNEIGFKKNLERKIKELLTSIQLERMYSKKEILEMYLMQCLFGEGTYGIQSSAKMMFGKKASDLKIEESALLIAQLKAPAHYNPFKHPERALERRNLVLFNMFGMCFISKDEYDSLKVLPLEISEEKETFEGIAPYYTEHIRQQLRDSKEKWNLDYLKDGLTVYTTLDSRIQAIADSMVKKHVPILNKETKQRFVKDKWKGLRKFVRANYDSTRWEFKMKDSLMLDSLVDAKLKPQVALIALDPKNGNILAMVGGTDFKEHKYNNALQAWRQPGSIFKPIVYLAALDNGYSPATTLINQPVVVVMPDGSRWQPGNYNIENMGGFISLREGLRHSLNLISVRLIMELISPKEVISYAQKLGVNTKYIIPVNSIALGSGALRPIDIITAYSTIANKGTYIKPFDILKVEDKNGNTVSQNFTEKSVAISEETAYLITNMMEDVIDNGTGSRLRWHYDFRHPVAGKTGTTNDFTDAWFCGFTPKIAIVVWVGLKDPAYKLGEGATGSNTALPIWGDFITEVYKKLKWQAESFEAPEGIVEIETCKESMKPAGPYCPKTYKEKYNKKYLPTTKCDIHTARNINLKNKDGRY
ncbi:MAG: PBP1A family penicillin-binding protein [Candidatus Delongbacteria bacterium]|nr:PBP1A family penicillin-binding protein [Candidatus Delongbacteria bacterium]MCG2760526.1 PBP1A family penicillin-binding protein [Candidatus Delongbacteria bacterium]